MQPVQPNDLFKSSDNIDKNENKNLNIDLEIKDTNNFYIMIPNSYNTSQFIITFDINYIYDLNTIISNIVLVIVNECNKSLFFKFKNNNIYYQENFNNIINENSIVKLSLDVINKDYFIVNKFIYKKN